MIPILILVVVVIFSMIKLHGSYNEFFDNHK